MRKAELVHAKGIVAITFTEQHSVYICCAVAVHRCSEMRVFLFVTSNTILVSVAADAEYAANQGEMKRQCGHQVHYGDILQVAFLFPYTLYTVLHTSSNSK